MEGTVSIRILQPVFSWARLQGLDVAPLIAATALPPEDLLDGDQRIDQDAFFRTMAAAVHVAKDEDFGLHVARFIQFHAVAGWSVVSEYVLAQLILTSPTVADALANVAWAYPLTYGDARLALHHDGDRTIVRYLPNDERVPRVVVDYAVAWMVCALRAGATRDFLPAATRFRHTAPPDLTAYREVFGDAIAFGAGEDAFEVSSENGAIPLASANAQLHSAVRKRAERALEAMRHERYGDHVRDVVRSELSRGNPTADRVAEALRVSPRTLARRLAEEGTTYQAIVDGVRSALAEQHLRAGRSVAEVTRLVGFAEVSAFNRAFRRWFGCSPGVWMKQH